MATIYMENVKTVKTKCTIILCC